MSDLIKAKAHFELFLKNKARRIPKSSKTLKKPKQVHYKICNYYTS